MLPELLTRLGNIERDLAAIKQAMGTGNSPSRAAYPHIASTADYYHGWPHIAGRRMPVFSVVDLYLSGMTVEQIMEDYALTAAEVHAALAYYYDHRAEIETQIAEDERIYNEAAAQQGAAPGEGKSIRERFDLPPEDTPCPQVDKVIAQLGENPETWREL